MSPSPIGVVICRVAAIWLAVSGLGGIALMIGTLVIAPGELGSFFAYSVVTALIPLISAFVLWHYAETISSFRFSSTGTTFGESVDKDVLLNTGILLVGIWMLAFGLISVFGTETVGWLQSNLFQDNETISDGLSPHIIGQRVSNAAQIAMGSGLIVWGRRGLR